MSESGPVDGSPGDWLRRLDGPAGLAPASHPPMIAEATERLQESAVRWAIDLGHRMASRIIAAVPELGGGDEAFEPSGWERNPPS